jgi:hypothetical protein
VFRQSLLTASDDLFDDDGHANRLGALRHLGCRELSSSSENLELIRRSHTGISVNETADDEGQSNQHDRGG